MRWRCSMRPTNPQNDDARHHGFESGGGFRDLGAGRAQPADIFQAFAGTADEAMQGRIQGYALRRLKKQGDGITVSSSEPFQ